MAILSVKGDENSMAYHGRKPRGVKTPPHFEVGTANVFQPPEFVTYGIFFYKVITYVMLHNDDTVPFLLIRFKCNQV